MKSWTAIAICGLVLGAAVDCRAGHGMAVEFFFGGAWSLPTALEVEQTGQPAVEIDARYKTRPFEQPLYWAVRIEWGGKTPRWELQLLHHKIYLENPTPPVDHFEVTHGYNVFTFNRTFDRGYAVLRAGAGVVIAHAESVVRGEYDHGDGRGILDTGYELAGPALIVGAGRSLPVRWNLFVTPEIQLSAAWAKVSVADGKAIAPNVALHLVVGIGYAF